MEKMTLKLRIEVWEEITQGKLGEWRPWTCGKTGRGHSLCKCLQGIEIMAHMKKQGCLSWGINHALALSNSNLPLFLFLCSCEWHSYLPSHPGQYMHTFLFSFLSIPPSKPINHHLSSNSVANGFLLFKLIVSSLHCCDSLCTYLLASLPCPPLAYNLHHCSSALFGTWSISNISPSRTPQCLLLWPLRLASALSQARWGLVWFTLCSTFQNHLFLAAHLYVS